MKNKMTGAVRAYNKAIFIRFSEIEIGEECDRHYDAGEWSGKAYADLYEKTEERIAEQTANNFGVQLVDLEIAVYEEDHNCHNRWLDSQTGARS